jgi:hypothetical protein
MYPKDLSVTVSNSNHEPYFYGKQKNARPLVSENKCELFIKAEVSHRNTNTP